MEIQPASIDQLKKGKDGKYVLIENDVGNVASDLQRISSDLKLRYSDIGDYYVVYREWMEGFELKQKLVTTSTECDQRLVKRVEFITSDHYNFAEEVDRMDREAEKAADKAFSEKVGEIGERLSHAIRKDSEK